MKFSSVLELKQLLLHSPLRGMIAARAVADMAVRSRHITAAAAGAPARMALRGLSLGIARQTGPRDYALAVRIQDRQLLNSPVVEAIRRKARGEVDVRYTGTVRSLAAKKVTGRTGHWQRRRWRPLEIGISCSHKDGTAGTIGAFVRKGRDGAWYLLSNNHVLANVNEARIGDEILQPGPLDGGRLREADIAAHLTKFTRISFTAPNLVDCAIAKVKEGIGVVPDRIHGIGDLGAPRAETLEPMLEVRKLGRTTGLRAGIVTAVALDDVGVAMETSSGVRVAFFDDQIEIESTAAGQPFCRGGDSGSLIVDEENQPAALLFAGADEGGAHDLGLTYANPLAAVINALGIRFE